ncbi:MAG: fimbrillin family protein [Bacteroidales bacterium]|nr:fimbrillin family protein [Bacteroidales bacterium]
MKKLMILAVAAIALVACSRTFNTHHHGNEGKAIGFSTWAETMTKTAANTVANSFAVGDDFTVFGIKTKSTTNTTVFTNAKVEKTVVAPETWSCTPVQYWDDDADSYTFYAIAPHSVGGTATLTPATGAIAASNIVFAGNDNDILLAEQKIVNKGVAPYFNNHGAVPMVFHHAAALFDLNVKMSSDLEAADAEVKITSIELQNIDSKGNLTVTTGYTTDPVANATWATVEEAGNPTVNDFSAGCEDVSANLGVDIADQTVPIISKLIVLPQTFRTTGSYIQKVAIEYSIKQNGGDWVAYTPDAYNLTLFDNVDNKVNTDTAVSGWAKGTHYTYTITIDANAIKFTATIQNWLDGGNSWNYLAN